MNSLRNTFSYLVIQVGRSVLVIYRFQCCRRHQKHNISRGTVNGDVDVWTFIKNKNSQKIKSQQLARQQLSEQLNSTLDRIRK